MKSREGKKSQKKVGPLEKKNAHTQNVRKVANRCVFQMVCGSGRSKSRRAKVAVQERNEELHAAVARSAFSSQNV